MASTHNNPRMASYDEAEDACRRLSFPLKVAFRTTPHGEDHKCELHSEDDLADLFDSHSESPSGTIYLEIL